MLQTVGTKRSVFDTRPNDTERLKLSTFPSYTKHLDILDTLTSDTKYANILQNYLMIENVKKSRRHYQKYKTSRYLGDTIQ